MAANRTRFSPEPDRLPVRRAAPPHARGPGRSRTRNPDRGPPRPTPLHPRRPVGAAGSPDVRQPDPTGDAALRWHMAGLPVRPGPRRPLPPASLRAVDGAGWTGYLRPVALGRPAPQRPAQTL